MTQGLGRPTGSPTAIVSLPRRRLGDLPGPPASLSLRATALGPPDADHLRLPGTGVPEGEDHLEEVIRQLRVLQGPEAALRVVDVEPDSHLSENWATLAPWSAEGRGRRRRRG